MNNLSSVYSGEDQISVTFLLNKNEEEGKRSIKTVVVGHNLGLVSKAHSGFDARLAGSHNSTLASPWTQGEYNKLRFYGDSFGKESIALPEIQLAVNVENPGDLVVELTIFVPNCYRPRIVAKEVLRTSPGVASNMYPILAISAALAKSSIELVPLGEAG